MELCSSLLLPLTILGGLQAVTAQNIAAPSGTYGFLITTLVAQSSNDSGSGILGTFIRRRARALRG
jgi:hypothetical protein